MKSFKSNKRFAVVGNFLLICFLFNNLACHSASLASGKGVSGAPVENHQTDNNATIQPSRPPAKKAALKVAGSYELKTYRVGKEGYVNSLSIAEPSNGKIEIYYEGTFVFPANGAETFHETEARGELTLKGNQASGKLFEEYGGNGCRIALNFTNERVNLKSTNCDLRVTPDGDYRKLSEKELQNETAAADDDKMTEKEENSEPANASDDASRKPRVQYDASDKPLDIINLMEHDGEREGCADEILTFSGKVLKVDYRGDYVYEFTLADGNRKRQNFAMVIAIEDKLPVAHLRSIVTVGNNLEIRYINCGNAPIATPTEIYKL